MPNATPLGFILKGYPRISETFISNEIRLLEEQGFNIHIFSMRKPRESFTHDSVKAINATVTYLPESIVWGLPILVGHTLLCALRHPKRFASGLSLLCKRFSSAPKKHTWLKHFMQGCFLANKAAPAQIAHVHAHFAHTPTSVAMYASQLMDIPFSFTAHAKDIYTQSPERIKEKLTLARFVFTCTNYNKQFLDALSLENKKVHCVYHGIDLSLFSTKDRTTTASAPYHIMTVARFVEKKGLPEVLHAIALLRQRGLQVRYTLIGDGAQRKKIHALITQLGLADITELPGTIPHEKVLEYYRSADLFLLGCREAEDGDRDGIPNVIAEAMAMGVVVTATTVSGIPELIENGVTGCLAPPSDANALADAAQKALTDSDLRKNIIPAAKAKVHRVFNNRELVKDLTKVFKDNDVASR